MQTEWVGTLEGLQVSEAVADGSLQVFGLKGAKEGTLSYLTLDEGLAASTVEVTEVGEGGSVPHLKVVNKGEVNLFLMAGELLIGAKQNRVINASTMLGAGREWTVDVSCVESGRWRYASPKFYSAGSSSPSRLRRMMLRQSSDAYRREGRPRSDQGAVWRAVSRKLLSMGSKSPSAALEQAYTDYRAKLDQTLAEVPAPAGCCGAVMAIGGRIAGLELFDKSATLAKLWSKLLKGYAIDALEEPDTERKVKREEVVSWLRSPAGCCAERFKSPGLGDEVRMESDTVVGACLMVEDCPVHLELFPRYKDEA